MVKLDFKKNPDKMKKIFHRFKLFGISSSCFLEEDVEREIEKTIQSKYWYLLRQSADGYDVRILGLWEF